MKRLILTIALVLLASSPIVSEEIPELVVGIKEAPPFAIRSDDGEWSGLAIELWEAVAERADLKYRYREYDLISVFAAVEAGEVDVAVGALTMTPERESRVDFSHAYFTSGLSIAVKRKKAYGFWHALERFGSPGFLKVVLTLTVVLLVSGFLVWFFERKKNPEMFGGPAHLGIGAGFWWAAVTMTTVGYGDKAPATPGGRAVALFWMFCSLIIISGFTAAIASALTIGALASPITGPDDLTGARVMSLSDSSSHAWLRDHGISFVSVASVAEGLEGLRTDQTDAVVYDAPILSYLVRRDPSNSLIVLPQWFQHEAYAFALPSGSDRTEDLNREILAITTSEAWREHVRNVVGSKF